MLVLGINSVYHESSVCLIRNGVIEFAVEEERLTRRKRAKEARVDNAHELPWTAIDLALSTLGAKLSDLDRVGFSFEPSLREPFSDSSSEANSWGTPIGEKTFAESLQKVPGLLSERGFRGKFDWWSHHLCHAASTYYPSPVESAAILVVDGIGEHGSSILAQGRGQDIKILESVSYPHSLGFLWEYLSQFLGFSCYDAAKVMGMAATGRAEKQRAAMAQLVWPTSDGKFEIHAEALPFRRPAFENLMEIFGVQPPVDLASLSTSHFDIAAALQEATEEILLARTRHLHRMTGESHLCVSGGVALNCVANRSLFEEGPFSEMTIFPAAHDGGTAVGAAALSSLEAGAKSIASTPSPYLGPDYSESVMQEALVEHQLEYRRPEDLVEAAAELLAEGKTVGWFQGRMEIGPRALGNRSILADPRDPDMRDRLNLVIKHRESFRPFAPSILDEELENWFQVKKPTTANRAMLLAYPMNQKLRGRVPAIVHADGSSRVQAVAQEINPKYHALLSAFQKRTGVPMLLNTSFNDQEPIVCHPRDAIKTFLKTPLDVLALGPFIVERAE